MDRDALYFHFANLGLVIIGILSIQKAMDPIITAFLVLGSIGGFYSAGISEIQGRRTSILL